MMRAVKKVPTELRRTAALGIVAALVTAPVAYSRNDPTVDVAPSRHTFIQPKDRLQAEGWFTPTPRSAPELSDEKAAEVARVLPLPRARLITPGFYYELIREQGDAEEGHYVLVERRCVPNVDMPDPCYLPERGRRDFPLRRE